MTNSFTLIKKYLLSPLYPDRHRLHLPVSSEEVGAGRHSGGQRRVDVRVRPRGVRPSGVVRSDLLLPARLPRRRAAFSLQLLPSGQLHHDALREAAVQSDAVLLGGLRPHRRPFLAGPTDHFLPRAAAACLAALLRQQWLAGYEPDGAITCASGNKEPYMWLLGQTGHLLVRRQAARRGFGSLFLHCNMAFMLFISNYTFMKF